MTSSKRKDPGGAGRRLAREKSVLEMIAQGRPLPEVLGALALSIEAGADGLICSILLCDEDGRHLRHGAAPSLPASFHRAIDGIAIGPGTTPCGVAAYTGKRVITADITTDPLWTGYREMALKHGLRACWTAPIKSSAGKVLGTFAMYYREPRSPSAADLGLILQAQDLAAVVLERNRVEENLLRSEKQLRITARARAMITECSRVLVRTIEESRLLQEMCRIGVQTGGYRVAWIGLARQDAGRTIQPAAVAGDDERYFESVRISWADDEFGRGPAGTAVRTRTTQVARDPAGEPRFKPWRREALARGYLAVAALPLVHQSETYGVFGLFSGEPETFGSEEIALLEELANDIAYGIFNLRQREAMRRAEEHQGLEHAVSRAIADASNVPAAVRAAIRTICASESWECGRYFRWDETAGVLRFSEAWHLPGTELAQYVEKSRALTYEPGVGLAGKALQSGEPLWVTDIGRDERVMQSGIAREAGMRSAFVFPVVSDGKPMGVLAFSSRKARDSEHGLVDALRAIGSQIGQFLRRKQAEEELRRFRVALDASADLILLVDPVHKRYLDVNDAACRELGYTREEFLQMGPHDIFSISHDELTELYARLLGGDESEKITEGVYRRKDGSVFPVESFRRAVRSENGDIIVAVARDISERRRRDEDLRRFRAAMDVSADLIWLIDPVAMRILDANDTACRKLDRTREEILAMGPHEIVGTSREELAGTYGRLVAGEQEATHGEAWYSRKDGSRFPVEVFRRVVPSQGGPVIVAVVRDISERRAAEEERKATEEKIRDQAHRQKLIADFGQQVLASADLDEVLARAMDLVADTLSADFCNVLELDAEGRKLVFKATRGWPAEWIGRRTISLRPGAPIELVLSRREPLVIHDLDEERFSSSPLRELGVRSGIQVPIYGKTRTFGALGAYSKRVRNFAEDDASFLQSVANILSVAIERRSADERLAYLAQFDALTALPNRHLFHDRLLQAMAQARRSTRPMAVLYVDLDRFKLVNDTRGHAAGDQLLKEAASRLARCTRSGDTVGRFGGDEFGVILSDLSRPGDATIVVQKMIDALAMPLSLDGQEIYVTASVGITLFPADGEEAGLLIRNADTAMYRAKEQGRNAYQYFTREMNERSLARVQMEVALRRAIERGEFFLHYQPKLNLKNGNISGFEALMRWRHPELGTVMPMEFIPVLEDSGLIVPVGEWVMGEVCRQIRVWMKTGCVVPPVAVNLSARQFQQKDLETVVRRVLSESGVDPSLIQFELTESLLMKEPEAAARTLALLKESGVRISVDDFGTGYSSLAYLKRFPIDALKIDRTFVRDITTNREDAAITLAIISLAHSLNLMVVAEGVETEEQLRFLCDHACDEMQGYYFSKPVAPSECEAMLRETRRLELPRAAPR
ncbi:MAG: EAL domain-containing protein [Burkholderiales bacterium]